MRSLLVFVACLSFAACGATAHDERDPLGAPRYVEGSGGGAAVAATSAAACGPNVRAIDQQSCELGAATCRTAGFTCECAQRQRRNCGGAAMAPVMLPPAWQCAPDDPSADRGDGCSHAAPADGAACTREGAQCGYTLDECGFANAIARCAHGVWAVEERMQAPPP